MKRAIFNSGNTSPLSNLSSASKRSVTPTSALSSKRSVTPTSSVASDADRSPVPISDLTVSKKEDASDDDEQQSTVNILVKYSTSNN
jgi:hypothetical protein